MRTNPPTISVFIYSVFWCTNAHTLFVEKAKLKFSRALREVIWPFHHPFAAWISSSNQSNIQPIITNQKKNKQKELFQKWPFPTHKISCFTNSLPKKKSSPLLTHLSSSHPPFDRSSGHGHFTLGQGARLVAANHGSRTQSFDRREFSSGETHTGSCWTTFIPKK